MVSRPFIVLLFIFACTIGFVKVAVSQGRIAFIDATKILKQMPEATDAESHLNQLVAQWNKEVGDMKSELTRKQRDYDRKKLIMTDAERQATEFDIADLTKRIENYRQAKYGPNGELGTQQALFMKNAYDKLNKAIEEVALDGKWDYIFDKSSKELALLYTNAKFDLTAAVSKKLGIETNDIFSIPLLNKNSKSVPPPQGNPNISIPPPPGAPGQPMNVPPNGQKPIIVNQTVPAPH